MEKIGEQKYLYSNSIYLLRIHITSFTGVVKQQLEKLEGFSCWKVILKFLKTDIYSYKVLY